MHRVRNTRAFALPLLLIVGACAESVTAPEPIKRPAPTDPNLGIFTPFLLPPGADWGHSFISFNRDRHLSVKFAHFDNGTPNGTVSGEGFFRTRGRAFGLLRVTNLVRVFDNCTPYSRPCTYNQSGDVPESSEVSGVARIGLRIVPFTLVLDSNHWPPQGWTPGMDPGRNYDIARLTLVCSFPWCGTTEYEGELHHEPTP